jgi:hypothetical protein
MKKQKALTFFILSFAFLLFHSESVAQNCKYDIWDVETGDWTVTESIKLRGEAATSFAFDAILGHSVFKGETNYHLITYLPTYLPESAFPQGSLATLTLEDGQQIQLESTLDGTKTDLFTMVGFEIAQEDLQLLTEIGLRDATFGSSPDRYSFENIKAKHQKKLKKAASCILQVE